MWSSSQSNVEGTGIFVHQCNNHHRLRLHGNDWASYYCWDKIVNISQVFYHFHEQGMSMVHYSSTKTPLPLFDQVVHDTILIDKEVRNGHKKYSWIQMLNLLQN